MTPERPLPDIDNRGEPDYPARITDIARALKDWPGPVVIATHADPDGDALGGALALRRALVKLGKTVLLPADAPRYLDFLSQPGELSEPLAGLPENALAVVLDVDVGNRLAGVPVEDTAVVGAAFTVVLDHHGTSNRVGDLVCVEPGQAATSQMVKDVLDALEFPWTEDEATPCLLGISSDTGGFRFGNTTPAVLRAAADLLAHGVPYAELNDRLQERRPDYYRMLGLVMSTVTFPLGGLAVCVTLTQKMRDEVGPTDDDSSDYVGLIRYAAGTQVALFLREEKTPDGLKVKLSVRARPGVSAQAICASLGGGGHVAAAGASFYEPLDVATARTLEAVRAELQRAGYSVPEA